MNGLLQTICQIGIFMICAQAVVHFRPQAAYEKYLKLLVSAMVLIQLFLPVSRFLFRGDGGDLEQKTQAFLEGLEEEMSAAERRAYETDALLEQMSLEEIRRRVEESAPGETVTEGGGTEGIGTEGIGTEGIGTKGIGTEGIGTEGIGTEGIGTKGVETESIGTEEIGTEGIGTKGIETKGIGKEGIGTEGIRTEAVGVGDAGTEDVGTGDNAIRIDRIQVEEIRVQTKTGSTE